MILLFRPLRLAVMLLGILGSSSAASAQLLFQFSEDNAQLTSDTPIPSSIVAGLETAAKRWSSAFSNPLTLSINIAFKPLALGMIADTSWTPDSVSYHDFRNALAADQQSSADRSALASLPTGNAFNLLLNHTSEASAANPALPYLDANNSTNNQTVLLTQADARALKLFRPTGGPADATITFNSDYATSFDFNPNNGITPGTIDFVGAATHELGHILGFTSGVDTLDYYAAKGLFPEDALPDVTALDLFRYSALSHSQGVIDWSVDSRDKYFSIDGGKTALAFFSTGTNLGDGEQASHWKEGVSPGIMNPDANPGQLLQIASDDLTALDVIGWNFSSVPEPSTYGLAAVALLGCAVTMRRRSRLVRAIKRPIESCGRS